MLKIRTQGVQGKVLLTTSKEIGYIDIRPDYDNYKITLDQFEGFDKDYKRREKTLITISTDDDVYFKGTFLELTTILNNHRDGV